MNDTNRITKIQIITNKEEEMINELTVTRPRRGIDKACVVAGTSRN